MPQSPAPLLSEMQEAYVDAAIVKLLALKNGTIRPGDGVTVTNRQKVVHLTTAIECLDTVVAHLKIEGL